MKTTFFLCADCSDEVEAYLEMDMSKQAQSSSSLGSGVSTPPSAPTSMTSSFHSHKGKQADQAYGTTQLNSLSNTLLLRNFQGCH